MIARKMIRILFTAAFGLGAGVIVALWIEHSTPLTLPMPDGPFAVGRTLLDWVSDKPDGRHELLAHLWYPAAAERSAATSEDYTPASMLPRGGLPGPALLKPLTWVFSLTSRDPAKVREHSFRDAAVSSRQAPYPVILLRGGASAEVARYSLLAEDLASHGYVVVGFDVPYRTSQVVFPDGRVFDEKPENNPELVEGAGLDALAARLAQDWSADMSLALDQLARLNDSDSTGRFTGKLDLQRAGAFGHSLGGSEALQFCHDDPRCKAALDLDGGLWGSFVHQDFSRPVMLLMSDHAGESDPESTEIAANLHSFLARIPTENRTAVMIRGANHYMFSDDALLRSRPLMWSLRKLHVTRIDSPRQLAIAQYAIRSFFDASLRASPASPPRILTTDYPELQAFQ